MQINSRSIKIIYKVHVIYDLTSLSLISCENDSGVAWQLIIIIHLFIIKSTQCD